MAEIFEVSRPEGAPLDVVFLHGLDGNARLSWSRAEPNTFWPQWLAEEIRTVSVWTVDYDAWSSGWRGRSMNMPDRAINLLALLQNHGIGERSLCFIAHSMGGLLVKEILMHAAEGRTGFAPFARVTKGVVFLATPHTGSGITKAVDALRMVYRGTPAVDDLKRNDAHLRQLNDRYRDWVDEARIRNLVFFETFPTQGVRVVDEASANPGIARVRPIPVDANHIDICKPSSRRDLVYGQVKRFVLDLLDEEGSKAVEPRHDGRTLGADWSNGGVSVVASQDTTKHSPIWNVPYPSDPNFLGRDAFISAIADVHAEPGARLVIAQAISGLGGIGKTQLAAHYAHAVAEKYEIVWWIDATDGTSIDQSLTELGLSIGLPRYTSASEVLAQLTRRTTRKSWLLIYDNVESPHVLRGRMPTRGQGHVIVTTRYQGWPAWTEEIVLPPLNPSSGVDYLVRESGDNDLRAAARITHLVDGLPLALAQVAAQVRSGITLADYAEALESRMVEALEPSTGLASYDRSIVEVVKLSIEGSLFQDTNAARMLQVFTYLAPEQVVETVLSTWPDGDPFSDPIIRARSLGALERLSLIRRLEGPKPAYAIHRVVQAVARDLYSTEQESAVKDVLQLLARAASMRGTRDHFWLENLAAHARALVPTSSVVAPLETERLLAFIASAQPPGPFRNVSKWAARELLTLVERRPDATDEDLMNALLAVHHASDFTLSRKPVELHRAIQIAKRTHGENSAIVGTLNLQLANHISRRPDWFIELDPPAEDLSLAEDLVTGALERSSSTMPPRTVALAHFLRAGIRAHCGRLELAKEEYLEALVVLDQAPSATTWRTTAAQVLLKFGQYADARQLIEPLVKERAGMAALPFIESGTADDIYQSCLTAQSDWAAYLGHIELRVASYNHDSFIGVYWRDLLKANNALAILCDPRVAEISEQIALALPKHIQKSLSSLNRPVPNPFNDRGGFLDVIEDLAIRDPEHLFLTEIDDLLRIQPFSRDHNFRLRIVIAIRRSREEAVRKKYGPGRDDKRTAELLLFYALAREASVRSEVDWSSAKETLDRALTFKDAVGDFGVAYAMIGVCTQHILPSQETLRSALDQMSNFDARSGSHTMKGYCDVPALLSRGARKARDLLGDASLARELALRAASIEEERHGRNFGSVASYLYEAGMYAAEDERLTLSPILAIRPLRESLEIVAACCGDASPRWAYHAFALSSILKDRGSHDDAVGLVQQAFDVFNVAYGPNHRYSSEAANLLRRLVADSGDC